MLVSNSPVVEMVLERQPKSNRIETTGEYQEMIFR